ncbi:zinc finger CCCH domain-containing protein 4 [Phragmites australis]|uniref:zinc finger CCCH domain-containing protein 4 n=1 Tax=Phragmites australis TaxID=29695 RepID=UPI002D78370C|nr:zinc finger CCCH domain-containing protein 4 [Phragmites australis]
MEPGAVVVEEGEHQLLEEARPRWPPLAVEAFRDRIVEKVKENRVTLIVGDTGCGKSSLVPQFLLEENMEPILCTQPRRFAVVAIARAIAESRNWQLGEEIGYHIGHSNVSNLNDKRSKIVFKTAGVVLEQMCDRGIAALRYKVIILDEVHERSVESDLVLASIKQFLMKKNDLRLVLMSATADITRYKEYFRDIGRGERVEVIAIPCSPRTSIYQRKVLYLEQIADILKINSQSLSTKYCSGPDASADADLNHDVYELIHKLLLHVHQSEPDISKSILVFLPTYYALEQQWIRLLPFSSTFKVHILHRSIDTDEALQTMKVSKYCRKVILATNIAESSVTIPGVAYVIDSCRSLQVYWDPIRKTDSAGLVWISKSQAEQRKGRTGRTCDGQIYRLVTGTFYSSLNDHEYPAILRLSLREQVLMVCCAESRSMNDPNVLLQKVLNPPDSDAIEDALDSLVQIRALDKTSSGRYEPTFYGCLLNSLPLSFDSSVLTLKFGELGALHEGILISIMLDIQPLPILQPFGYQALCRKYRDSYFKVSGSVQIGKKEGTTIGNLCAFQFWERVFKNKHRLEYLKDVANTQEPKESHTFLAKPEEEWCAIHNLVPAAFKNISEIYDDVMKQLHRFRPSFLVKINPPMYLQPSEFNHTCLCCEIPELEEDMDSLSLEAENSHSDSQKQCAKTPYVLPADFGTTTIVEMLKTFVKEMKIHHVEEKTISYRGWHHAFVQPTLETEGCVFFSNGLCNQGATCRFSHSSFAPKPVCKFFLTLQGCRNGNSCPYSHDRGSLISSPITYGICSQEGKATSLCCTKLLPADGDGHILVMNDKNLLFSSKLCQYYDASKIVACTPSLQSVESNSVTNGLKILQNLADPSHLIIGREHKLPVPWTKLQRVFWFADFDNDELNSEQVLLQKFFERIAIKILSERLSDLQVILIMKNTKYIQLQVERLARECFFFLSESFMFDEATLGWFSDISRYPRGMQVSAPVTYVFNMHPPTVTQFGDYPAELREALRRD